MHFLGSRCSNHAAGTDCSNLSPYPPPMQSGEKRMKCPKCGFDQPDKGAECVKCGIVFAKYAFKQDQRIRTGSIAAHPEPPVAAEMEESTAASFLKELLLYVKPEIDVFAFAGRALIFFILIVWGLKFIFSSIQSNYAGESFLHLINLPFHEAGHLIFSPFGRFIGASGGSLMQLLVPLICLLTFLIKTRDTFAASVALWWLGESLIDLAPYINDARDLKLILLGGVTGRDVADYHDWEFILRNLGMLKCDHFLAHAAHILGAILMITTFIWGGFLLYKQFRNINSEITYQE